MRLVLPFLCLLIVGCSEAEQNQNQTADAAAKSPEAGQTSPPSAKGSFDPDSAWVYLTTQVEFGSRVPGTPAHEACGNWLAQELRRHGGVVQDDRWSHADSLNRVWPLRNIWASFGPQQGSRILLLAHWDCRPWADSDPDPAKRGEPVLGANDAASGVAVLLEIARNLGRNAIPKGVDILFVDGEDMGAHDQPETFCIGSRRFASRMPAAYDMGILLDMVGDVDLRIPVDPYSYIHAPEVVDRVWRLGEAMSPGIFVREYGSPVIDDHIPLNEAGVPTIDLIDFEYPAWHTVHDNLSQVSSSSLAAVGRPVLALVLGE